MTHYINLALYVSLGMKIVKVHRALRFTQKAFLKQYVDHCTAKRALARTSFARDCWKMMVNSCFGKFIEQVRNHIRCIIAQNVESFTRWSSCPRYISSKIISENMVILFLSVPQVEMNKAYAVGFTILERSKEFMFSQFYKQIKPRLGRCKVAFSDTDSLLLIVKTKRKVDNLDKLKDIMDFSNYDPSHPKFNASNKNALGFFKDEMKGEKIDEFVGLRSKTYAMTTIGGKMHSRCKGIKKAYKKTIPFQSFKNCIQQVSSVRVTQYNISSKNHNLKTIRVNKLCFGSFDDKRHLYNCGVHSVPYGSFLIKRGCVGCKKTAVTF